MTIGAPAPHPARDNLIGGGAFLLIPAWLMRPGRETPFACSRSGSPQK
jgi:hypothetical protein